MRDDRPVLPVFLYGHAKGILRQLGNSRTETIVQPLSQRGRQSTLANLPDPSSIRNQKSGPLPHIDAKARFVCIQIA